MKCPSELTGWTSATSVTHVPCLLSMLSVGSVCITTLIAVVTHSMSLPELLAPGLGTRYSSRSDTLSALPHQTV